MSKYISLSNILDNLNGIYNTTVEGNDQFIDLALVDHDVEFEVCTYVEKKRIYQKYKK